MQDARRSDVEPTSAGFVRLPSAARHCAIAPRTLRAWVHAGRVKCYRPTARCLLFKIADLEAAMGRFATGGRAA